MPTVSWENICLPKEEGDLAGYKSCNRQAKMEAD
ncbi:hypothetical protein SLEP1_g27617 [Rubroshorea leprosula]|uniref:Uncharacterized protein n=1 Tax=Rubroshorea leprosula TaxID=152421 RepID=A0AAV5JQX1_9ROSI|nr:hypothetical protein SLEP1_g27617 [Rubroshorea leprosula]